MLGLTHEAVYGFSSDAGEGLDQLSSPIVAHNDLRLLYHSTAAFYSFRSTSLLPSCLDLSRYTRASEPPKPSSDLRQTASKSPRSCLMNPSLSSRPSPVHTSTLCLVD